MAAPETTETSGNDDRALVDACIRGDRAAWAELVARFGRLVYSVPRRYGLPPEACEDVFQDVFAILLRELPQVRDSQRLAKWLITVSVRESSKAARKAARREAPTPPVPPPLPADELERLERQQVVRDSLRELGDPCRSLLQELFSVDEPDYSAVAARLQMPVGSIGPTRGRCLKKLLGIVQRRLQP